MRGGSLSPQGPPLPDRGKGGAGGAGARGAGGGRPDEFAEERSNGAPLWGRFWVAGRRSRRAPRWGARVGWWRPPARWVGRGGGVPGRRARESCSIRLGGALTGARPHPDPLPEGEGVGRPHPDPLPEGEGVRELQRRIQCHSPPARSVRHRVVPAGTSGRRAVRGAGASLVPGHSRGRAERWGRPAPGQGPGIWEGRDGWERAAAPGTAET